MSIEYVSAKDIYTVYFTVYIQHNLITSARFKQAGEVCIRNYLMGDRLHPWLGKGLRTRRNENDIELYYEDIKEFSERVIIYERSLEEEDLFLIKIMMNIYSKPRYSQITKMPKHSLIDLVV